MADVVQSPIISATVNGTAVPVLSLEVELNNYWSPDTWRATLVLSDMPDALGLAFWAAAAPIAVALYAGYSEDTAAGPALPLISGSTDEVEVYLRDGLIDLTGRDATAAMVESRSTETFQNQTSSEVVTTIAGRHGLTASVTPTSRPVGQYNNGSTHVRDHQTEWELLTDLAKREGYDIYVKGTVLYFNPPAPGTTVTIPYQGPTAAQPITSAGFLCGRLRRRMLLTGNVTVNVVSWNGKNKQAITGTASQSGKGGQDANYTYRVPGLTQDQATTLATNNLAAIVAHASKFDLDIPFDPAITPRKLVKLTGTSSAFDTTYFIDEVRIRIGCDDGAVMSVSAKLAPPAAEG